MATDNTAQLESIEARIRALEADMEKWRHLQVAAESGGGNIVVGSDSVVLRINSLTPSGVQMP